ncbi:DnaJ domain-containing protein [Mycena albidolilacea]|uniref:DnaJ domain-containing protein n=1 Tax=Mycena albidolilacea TaxID=1033008 RepID=A0AAD7AK40_9AGAR|nr:DnaJ domain-containing protein [Mycena albidolilacea]
MVRRVPNYYKVLNIKKYATEEEIRTAYKKEALRTHPDRMVYASAVQWQKAKDKFQAVGEAYYVLSDPDERWEYDARDRNVFFRMFGCGSGGTGGIFADADGIFADVFAEVTNLLPSSLRVSWVPFARNAGLGYIIADVEGAMVGAEVGTVLDRERDAAGRSVAAIFKDLEVKKRAEILRALERRV